MIARGDPRAARNAAIALSSPRANSIAGPHRKCACPSLDSLSERRVSLLVILFGLLVYIPFAGTYGLHDPWETHYAEVARQMAVRGDFISLWWPGAPDRSRSLLVEAGAVVLDHEPVAADVRARASARRGRWRCRRAPSGRCALPFCLFGVLGIYAVYLCVSRFVSRRAGVMAAVVTATSPLYALVSRQAMTDMAFVGPMTMALALGALALFDDEDVPLPRREARLGRPQARPGRTTRCSTSRPGCSWS